MKAVISFRNAVLGLGITCMAWPAPGASSPATAPAAHAVRDAPAIAVASAPEDALPTEAVMPQTWLPSRGRECARRGKYKGFCQGPRRVPVPHGAEAELAERLGLGEVKTVHMVLLDPPNPDWVNAAGRGATQPLLWPVSDGKLWRGMQRVRRAAGSKRPGRIKHKGVDIGAPEGSLIRAVQDGIVAYANNEVRGYGNLLVTVHGDKSSAFYAHCRAIYVFPGQRVKRGQVVGEVGQTGIARGAHLHFEYRVDGRLRDPVRLFVGRPDE